jgi:RimJ/RimL family protein N-acetyltransferase
MQRRAPTGRPVRAGRRSYHVRSMSVQVTLRPVAEEDLAVIERLTNDPDGAGEYEWHGWHDPHVWRHRWAENGLMGSAAGTLMIIRGTGPVGFVSWRQATTGPISFCWELGIAIAPEARGQGVGTQAQQQVVRYLFRHTHVNRIQAGTEITNVAEQRALEKAGFTREGVLRGVTFRDGRWHDGVCYSILREEVNLSGVP